MSKAPKPNLKQEEHHLGDIFRNFWKGVVSWFRDFINLESGLDREGTIISIRKGMRMRGHSAWLLMCSIMIASLGLDLNSPAVIIGAMLISPLMSPILGVGLAVGINDKNMLYVSLQHYAVAILIALITSYIYFSFTPLGDVTKEILARTKPTTLDVLIAFAGGVAGIISGSRKDQSNAIPGVAIATALMPPLCVTGYGLAKGEWQIMLNSFYLFFFNAFFVALATFLIVRMLKFEEKEYATARERQRTHWLILGFSVLMIVPSTFILLQVLEDLKQKRVVDSFVETYFSGATNCIDYEVEKIDSTHLVLLKLIGPRVSEDSLKVYNDKLQSRFGAPVILSVVQDQDADLAELNRLKGEMNSVKEVAAELKKNYTQQNIQQTTIDSLMNNLDSLNQRTIPLEAIAKDLSIFMDNIASISFAAMQSTDFQSYEADFPTLLVEWKNKRQTRSKRKEQEEKLLQFVQQRAGLDTLKVISY
ncbi:MAG: DUF389 domain-containing protein [Bacteroidota bacterium]